MVAGFAAHFLLLVTVAVVTEKEILTVNGTTVVDAAAVAPTARAGIAIAKTAVTADDETAVDFDVDVDTNTNATETATTHESVANVAREPPVPQTAK